MSNQIDISILIPAYNEHESLPELCQWIKEVMVKNNFQWEVLIIDDGSTDGTWEVIQELSGKDPSVRGIKFRRNYGKSAALNTGFQHTEGDVVITMDADLQDSPEEIPALYSKIVEEDYDLISGWKKKRHDPLSKTIPSKFFNFVTRMVSGIKLHDFNCGLKAYDKEVVRTIEVYGQMHRFIPVIAKWTGFTKIGERVVEHQARKYGKTKFGIERFMIGFLDLMSITFVGKFGKRPMHLFGTLGVLFFTIGFFVLLYLSFGKFYWNMGDMDERPLFYFGILILIVGAQLFLTGFLAELVSRNSPSRNIYNIQDVTDNLELQVPKVQHSIITSSSIK